MPDRIDRPIDLDRLPPEAIKVVQSAQRLTQRGKLVANILFYLCLTILVVVLFL